MHTSAQIENSIVLSPSFIGAGVTLKNSVVGPYVSIGNNSSVENSVIENSIIQTHSKIKNRVITNSMIGNYVELSTSAEDLSIGDYTKTL